MYNEDEFMSESYRYCIKHQLSLPEEVIEWFYTKVDDVVAESDHSMVLSALRRWKLSYSPTRWASILKQESEARRG